MLVHNALPHLLECVERWERFPAPAEFAGYIDPIAPLIGPMLADFRGYRGSDLYPLAHAELSEPAAWASYRARVRKLSPEREEARLRAQIRGVEQCLGIRLEGEAALFGAFTLMDGYARFDSGSHRVFLGVDDEFESESSLDILVTHELAHVARESRASVWEPWGLPPRMTREEFVAGYPTLEHLFNEGFACVVSEAIHPTPNAPWRHVYQSAESWRSLSQAGRLAAIDRKVHAVLRDPARHHQEFYDVSSYGDVELPMFAHYVWAWAWAKSLSDRPLTEVVGRASRDRLESALAFRLEKFLTVT